MDDDHVEKELAVIRQNRRLTVREVAEEVGSISLNKLELSREHSSTWR